MLLTRLRLSGVRVSHASLGLVHLRLMSASGDIAGTGVCRSSLAPQAGSLDDMFDGSDGSACVWSAAAANSPGFFVEFEFPAEVNVDEVQLAIMPDGGMLHALSVELFQSGTWLVVARRNFADRNVSVPLDYGYTELIFAQAPSTYLRCNELSGDAINGMGGANFLFSSNAIRASIFEGRSGFRVMPGTTGIYAPVYAPNTTVGRMEAAFTLSFLARIDENGSLVGKEVGGLYYPEWVLAADNGRVKLDVYRSSAAQNYILTATSAQVCLIPSTLQHFAVVRADTSYKVYVDGVLVISATASGTPWSGATYLGFGGSYSHGGFPFTKVAGFYSDLAIWGRTLSELEILSQAAAWKAELVEAATSNVIGVDAYKSEEGEPPSPHDRALMPADITLDMEFGGRGCIYGTVELYAQAGNIPLPRRVRLHRSRDGLLVRETWSDAQGNYRFDYISERYKYDVTAWDHEGLQQSVVANDLAPEPMQ